MAVMLTRKWAYDALIAKDGFFLDEGFFMYASDCDMALRMASCGIRGVQLDVPYWHYGWLHTGWLRRPRGTQCGAKPTWTAPTLYESMASAWTRWSTASGPVT